MSNGYIPKPFDLSTVTLTRELYQLAETLAMNCHEVWTSKKKVELESVGAAVHHLLVPYELLTDREKTKDLHFAQELIKFLQTNGYRIQRYILKSSNFFFNCLPKEMIFVHTF